MSRRHHGGRPHRFNGPSRPLDTSRPVAQTGRPDGPPAIDPIADHRPDAGATVVEAALEERPRPASPPPLASTIAPTIASPTIGAAPERADGEPLSRVSDPGAARTDGHALGDGPTTREQPDRPDGPRPANGQAFVAGGACTAPQLRRFIKSRPYVPMHELRRRFAIDGVEDDVTPVELSTGRIYVGLPPREGSLLGELLRGGEIGYELSLDPRSPVVVGLYPMRPVARN